MSLLEIVQMSMANSLTWAYLASASMGILVLWLIAYVVSFTCHPPATSRRRDHFLPMLRHLFTYIL